MSIDSYTTTALVDEFNQRLAGGRIQDVVELDRETFGFEVYADHARHYLLLSAENLKPRAILMPEKLRRGVQTPSTLGLLMRNRVEGMRIVAVEQPPWERIIVFNLMGPDSELQLIIELIERRANLILVEDGMILECARRVAGDDNRYRIILPRHAYVEPPPMEGIHPNDLNPTTLDKIFRQHMEDKAWLALVKGVLGFSPLLAKEIIFRAHKDVKLNALEVNPYSVHAALGAILPPLTRHQWQSGVVIHDGAPFSVSVFKVLQKDGWQSTETVSDAINTFYGPLEGAAVYDAAKEPIREQLKNAVSRARGKLISLERQTVDDSAVELLRKSGELLLAYQYTMKPGQTLLVEQYDVDAPPLRIKVDPEITPLENAQNYFAKYDKAKKARAAVPQQLKLAEQEMAYLEQLDADLDMAENWQEIGEVQDELQQGGYWRGTKTVRPTQGKSGPKRTEMDGFTIWVGRNARQNDIVTWDKSTPEDLWFHARGMPGAHVLIKINGREVPKQVIEHAAGLAAYYSKGKNDKRVEVAMAERRHLQKPKRGRPGQVMVRQEMGSIYATPVALENDEED